MTPSPCLKICIYDHTLNYCTGCYRTIDEIKQWPYLNESNKQRIANSLEQRKLNNLLNSQSAQSK